MTLLPANRNIYDVFKAIAKHRKVIKYVCALLKEKKIKQHHQSFFGVIKGSGNETCNSHKSQRLIIGLHITKVIYIKIGTFILCKVYYCDCIDIMLSFETFILLFFFFFLDMPKQCNGTHEIRIKKPNVFRSLWSLKVKVFSNAVHKMIFNVFSMFVPRFHIQITFFS